MRLASFTRTLLVCLALLGLSGPASASTDTSRMLAYLTGATSEDAAGYLAYLIRSFGCEVRRDERQAFNDAVLDHLAFDFGVVAYDLDENGARIVPEALREGMFAFSFRAGPYLVESGELVIDRDGTARLLTCNALIS